MRLNASQLRVSDPDQEQKKSVVKNPITIILDNVLDTYNIGAIFTLADAVAAEKIYLCGNTETPPNPRIKKASINTWKWVDWEYVQTAKDAVTKLRDQSASRRTKIKIVSIEQNDKSIQLKHLKVEYPVALIVGNETHGISKNVLDISDSIVELPMFGINTSLNVMVSLGIVLYKVIEISNK
jgi:23S rRNA (guanosine2251-2'-O)-methyltransferase